MNNETKTTHLSVESIGGNLAFMDALNDFCIAQTAADVAVETDPDYAIYERSAARQMQNLIVAIDGYIVRQITLLLSENTAGKDEAA